MDDCQNVNLIRFYTVNYSIWCFYQLADIICLVFQNFSSLKWMVCDLLGSSGNSIHHPLGKCGRIKSDVFVNVNKMPNGVLCPVNPHLINPNLLRTSLTSIVRPSSLSFSPASMA